MILDYLSNGKDGLIMFILSIPVILFSLSFHEAAHGYIAYKMGDPTARKFGRLTLNPLKHLTPLGTITMLV
ncbi:MAG: site-2 protease family protein, partial [Clostridia bacterium]|nr:site-2 protease family protein [Clostridia bacterium]